jgi:very-short-patch-repair endonuclease
MDKEYYNYPMAFLRITRNRDMYHGAGEEGKRLSHRLRRNMTPAEKELWWKLRNKNLYGAKFRRQHSVACFIADFYCHELKLVIEEDGLIHSQNEKSTSDDNRTAEFERLGIKTLRFTNDEVLHQMEKVMEFIKNEILFIRTQNQGQDNALIINLNKKRPARN